MKGEPPLPPGFYVPLIKNLVSGVLEAVLQTITIVPRVGEGVALQT